MNATGALARLARHTTVRESIYAFAAVTIANACAYAFQVGASRLLPLSQFGAVAALLSLINIVTVPSLVAMTAVARSTAELKVVEDVPRIRGLVDIFLAQGAVTGAITAGLLLVFRNEIAAYLKIDDVATLIPTALVVLGTSLVPPFRGALQGLRDFRGYFVSNAADGFGRIAFGVASMAVGFGVRGAMWGLAIAAIPALAGSTVPLRRRLPGRARSHRLPLARIVQAVLGIAATTACILVLTGLDVIIVKHVFDPVSAGTYGALSLVGRIVFFGLSFVASILLPTATALASSGSDTRPLLLRSLGVVTLLALIAVAVTTIAPRAVLAIVSGERYAAAAPYLGPYAEAMALFSLTYLCATYKIALHDFRFLYGLVPLTIAEAVGLAQFHASTIQIITVLRLVGVFTLLATLLIGRRRASGAFDIRIDMEPYPPA